MIHGLDLFSGIGGISLALADYVRTVAYCERDRYAQSVLISRMAEGKLHAAPIWDDVRTLKGSMLPSIDIIIGGFPCQDISLAGKGTGLEGKRSGLFFEIMRLAEEIKPKFLFLENVSAIRTRGLDRVVEELTKAGYDCRWCMLSAASVGAPHIRERWFLLAKSKVHDDRGELRELLGKDETIQRQDDEHQNKTEFTGDPSQDSTLLADSEEQRIQGLWTSGKQVANPYVEEKLPVCEGEGHQPTFWDVEPDVGRVAHGVPFRVDRIRCLGNAVVPLQAKVAFEKLMGIT